MITIVNANSNYIVDIERIANNSNEYLVPNNHMIYYLCCTVFSKYSFVALNDGIPIGYLFCVSNHEEKYVWMHQLAINNKNRKLGVASKLIIELENLLLKENYFTTIRGAIKSENIPSKKMVLKHNFKFIGIDSYINMEIAEKQIK